jgi:sterol desaturase/sphingolipid hydroxylase (fatty acid hydroxylase superfamily)
MLTISKDFGLVIAAGLAVAFTTGVHACFRAYWGSFVALFGGTSNTVLFGSLTVYVIQYVVSNLIYACLYYFEVPFFEQYKINPKPWPWKGNADDRKRFWATLSKVPVSWLVTTFLVTGPVNAAFYFSLSPHGWFNANPADIPSLWTFVWQLAVCFIVEDALFYVAHRTLHHPSIYPSIHKQVPTCHLRH